MVGSSVQSVQVSVLRANHGPTACRGQAHEPRDRGIVPAKGPSDDSGDGPKSTYYSAEEAKGTWQSLRARTRWNTHAPEPDTKRLVRTTISTEFVAFSDSPGLDTGQWSSSPASPLGEFDAGQPSAVNIHPL
ncbi:unnamed protein product [Clonostachys solani]|uniref:Uncharacterized protein n=1 Tax=Clonostachys solani TaxID=160281 RepID=A0A9N9W065_9HYPO|nr:unnamed protein product [Clonostachys solani]